MPSNQPTWGSLPPGHRCRVDDLAYESVSAWFHDHHVASRSRPLRLWTNT